MSQNPQSINHQPLKINAPDEEGGGERSLAQDDGRSVRRKALRDEGMAAASGSNFTDSERSAMRALIDSITGA